MMTNQGRLDDRELIYASDEACQCGSGSSHRRNAHTNTNNPGAGRCSSVRAIALTLFLLASAYWFYKVYTNATGRHDLLGGWDSPADKAARLQQTHLRSHLKLISVFQRHGDRAPSDSLPPGDDISRRTNLFWPRGLNNLTDSGRYRQFRLGLELRRRYERHLDYQASHYLALSSPMQRCRESLELTLAGLFDIDITLTRGLDQVRQYNACANNNNNNNNSSTSAACAALPAGSGSPSEWKQISIDSTTMPMLEYTYLNGCKYRLANPTPVDANLEASAELAKLKGLSELKTILEARYQAAFNFSALGLWSTLAGELRLARTNESIAYGQHAFDWVTQQVVAYEGQAPITLFDLYEQVALLGYRDRVVETARLVQLGPLLTSLVTSQQVALGRPDVDEILASPFSLEYDSSELYRQKRAVIYSSHDSILQLLMHHLGLIRASASNYAEQFNKWRKANDADQLLQGLRMSQFGMSLVFELYEMVAAPPVDGAKSEQDKFAYLQAALYNEADGKYKPVEFQRLDLGRACRRLFEEQNGGKSADAFYQHVKFPLDEARHCPFELFVNVTRNTLISSQELNKLCG